MDIYNYLPNCDPAWEAVAQGFDPKAQRPEGFLRSLGLGQVGGPQAPEILTFDEACNAADELSIPIWSSFHALEAITHQSNGNTAAKWGALSQAERVIKLEEAWGCKMPESHGPHMEQFLKHVDRLDAQGVVLRDRLNLLKNLDALRLPQINLADLASNVHNIPALLQSRTRLPPPAFWRDDLRRQYLGQNTCILQGPFIALHAMFFDDEVDYGRPVPFAGDTNDATFESLLCRDACASGDGFLVLQAQARLYVFLAALAKDLLSGGRIRLTRPNPHSKAKMLY